MTESDIKRFARLGRADSIQPGKARPVLIQFRDRIFKNMLMESVGKLKGADDKYNKIIFTHDMTTGRSINVWWLMQKNKQNDETSGEYIYSVKGAPGSFRVIKIWRRY